MPLARPVIESLTPTGFFAAREPARGRLVRQVGRCVPREPGLRPAAAGGQAAVQRRRGVSHVGAARDGTRAGRGREPSGHGARAPLAADRARAVRVPRALLQAVQMECHEAPAVQLLEHVLLPPRALGAGGAERDTDDSPPRRAAHGEAQIETLAGRLQGGLLQADREGRRGLGGAGRRADDREGRQHGEHERERRQRRLEGPVRPRARVCPRDVRKPWGDRPRASRVLRKVSVPSRPWRFYRTVRRYDWSVLPFHFEQFSAHSRIAERGAQESNRPA